MQDRIPTETTNLDLTTFDESVGEFVDKYAVENIVGSDVADGKILCWVRGYDCPPKDDTAKPAENISLNFIARY